MQRQVVRPAPGLAATGVPSSVHEVVRSPGRDLPLAVRQLMEPRFGHGFGDVRVHTDATAARTARAVDARAYTVGRNVVFGDGQFMPDSTAGRRLIAHELTHVIQQRGGGGALATRPSTVSSPSDPAEREADRVADAVSKAPGSGGNDPGTSLVINGSSGAAPTIRASGQVLQRQDHAAEVAQHTNDFQTAVRALAWREAVGVLAWFNAHDIDTLLGASNLGPVELTNLRETAKDVFPADVETNPDHIANIVDRRLQAAAQALPAPLSGGAAIAAQKVPLATSVERSHWRSDAERLRFIREYLDYAKGRPELQTLYDEGIARYGDQLAAASRPGLTQQPDPLASGTKQLPPARAVRIVQFSHFMVGMGELVVSATLPEGALQLGPDPSAGYNFDTYLMNMDTGQQIPAQWLGGTRYRVFMGTENCPGCHFGQGLIVDLVGENPVAIMLPPVMGALASIAEGAAAEEALAPVKPPQAGAEPVTPPEATPQEAETTAPAQAAGKPVSSLADRVHFGDLENGRPTGVIGELHPSDLRTGTPTGRTYPPGLESGELPRASAARGHLLARVLGGRGTDPRNLAYLHRFINGSVFKTLFENPVLNALESGDIVRFGVRPLFRGDAAAPYAIEVWAEGTNGTIVPVRSILTPGLSDIPMPSGGGGR